MAFKTITAVLGSAVADDGTFTLPYPAGTNQADFIGANASATGVAIVNENDIYNEGDPGIGLAYGLSSITLTNLSGQTWPAGSTLTVQLGQLGPDQSFLDPTPAAASAVVGAAPTVSGLTTSVKYDDTGFFRLDFHLNAVSVTVTDAAGSGSYGALKLFDFVPGSVRILGARQNYTAFAEGAALTGGAGDAVFDIGVGSVAKAAAADGALGGANDDDVAGEIAITLSGGTGTGTLHSATNIVLDGTSTAADLYLNWSGTAATIDATSTIAVTGTITVIGAMMGDD